MSFPQAEPLETFNFINSPPILSIGFGETDELLLMLEPGHLLRFCRKSRDMSWVANCEKLLEIGGKTRFDPNAPTSYYALAGLVVVANDKLQHGLVAYPKGQTDLNLYRKEYGTSHSEYPLALFHRDEIPHLIYSSDWNRLDIIRLDTRQNLTAAKSLIELDAEAHHISFYERYSEPDVHIWPSPFDYFYGRLLMSPDRRKFLSKGWVWGSSDACYIFDIDDFIENPRIKYQIAFRGEHETRGVCWVDNERIALLYHPWMEGDTTDQEAPLEIHISYPDDGDDARTTRIQLEATTKMENELTYYPSTGGFATYTRNCAGISIYDDKGKLVFRDQTLTISAISADGTEFASIDGHLVHIFKLQTDPAAALQE